MGGSTMEGMHQFTPIEPAPSVSSSNHEETSTVRGRVNVRGILCASATAVMGLVAIVAMCGTNPTTASSHLSAQGSRRFFKADLAADHVAVPLVSTASKGVAYFTL